jgi:hypothetical protein
MYRAAAGGGAWHRRIARLALESYEEGEDRSRRRRVREGGYQVVCASPPQRPRGVGVGQETNGGGRAVGSGDADVAEALDAAQRQAPKHLTLRRLRAGLGVAGIVTSPDDQPYLREATLFPLNPRRGRAESYSREAALPNGIVLHVLAAAEYWITRARASRTAPRGCPGCCAPRGAARPARAPNRTPPVSAREGPREAPSDRRPPRRRVGVARGRAADFALSGRSDCR